MDSNSSFGGIEINKLPDDIKPEQVAINELPWNGRRFAYHLAKQPFTSIALTMKIPRNPWYILGGCFRVRLSQKIWDIKYRN